MLDGFFKWILLTVLIFVGVNWAIRPFIPNLIPPFTIILAAGAAACLMVIHLLFGKR